MINKKENIFKILTSSYSSEKSSILSEKNNTFTFKVLKNSKKSEIKSSIEKFFNVKVKKVRTVMLKGKSKKHKNIIGKRKNWKKAYVVLKKNQKINLIKNIE
ncbi:rplW [Wigglesworthia glossinidia endosymbiont of Glossina brevipalpis]|uniref:Large ribosomal subunit protein uL23 n=1 Tax=Wigglesworthia glossinidia brevipalpis TaxID=36870 RepID=RL23_WIGBR|nr:RecName: Full=Large ribosomal subunit protein uL23; AltName: Full=50S ribosomal protein L23 [Wigglesworthia glossinidia endosymbiont of Glossina brevipalpis]BAC24691.1 rplW [Wigglesworthia glossinidia endosymbiont of Glossina brevipalpis]